MASQNDEQLQAPKSSLIVRENCLGIIRKNGNFSPMTNIGYVRAPTASNAIGFLIKIKHADNYGPVGDSSQDETNSIEGR